MGVNGTQIGVFGTHVLDDGDQYRVLEHVGMVACVVSVAITEHAPMVTAGVMASAPTGARRPWTIRKCLQQALPKVLAGPVLRCLWQWQGGAAKGEFRFCIMDGFRSALWPRGETFHTT
jgi:hypothetical protein